MAKFFILGAGLGTRLFPFSFVIPKVLLPVGNKPCIRWIVDSIIRQGFKEDIFICCLRRDLDLFQHEFRDAEVQFIISEEPLGSAGQLYSVKDMITEDFVVWYGDDLIALDLDDLFFEYKKNNSDAMLVVTPNVPTDFGIVNFDEKLRFIKHFEEKHFVGKDVWSGVAVFDKSVKKYLRKNWDFARDVFSKMLKDGCKLQVYVSNSVWFDIGNVASYMKANELARKGELKL